MARGWRRSSRRDEGHLQGDAAGLPREAHRRLRRAIHISPFWEEDYGQLAELLGEENVLFGSDFPHPEGLGDPITFVDDLAHLGEERVRKFMGGSLARLMNVDNVAVVDRPAAAVG